MRASPLLRWVRLALLAGLVPGCAERVPVQTVEMQDERTAITIGALYKPLAYVETGIYDLLVPDKQASIIYLGPVEWDRSGESRYFLWVQVAPGVGGHGLDDIQARGAFSLKLDDGAVTLTALNSPVMMRAAYSLTLPWGETAYFPVDVPLLKRLAASEKITLKVRAGDLSFVDFVQLQDSRAAFTQFLIDRSID